VRRWRLARAQRRAVEEVERGIEMGRGGGESKEHIIGGSMNGAYSSESKERIVGDTCTMQSGSGGESRDNMVFESRVEIIVEGDDKSERNVLDEWDGWSAGVGMDGNEEEERGRKGMSLPRREW
jgi:hypothetical protein